MSYIYCINDEIEFLDEASCKIKQIRNQKIM